MLAGFSRHLASGLRRQVPEPVHGASTSTRSNRGAQRRERRLVARRPSPARCARPPASGARRSGAAAACRRHRRRSGRCSASPAASASVLPPAPAHRSSTCMRGPAPASSAAICEPSSCTSNQPLPCAASASRCGAACRPLRARGMRTPGRRQRRRHGAVAVERLQHLLARRLQRVDAQIDGRARAQRRALLGRARAEGALERRQQPVGNVAGDVRRAHRRAAPRRGRPSPPRSAARARARSRRRPPPPRPRVMPKRARRGAQRERARRVGAHLRGDASCAGAARRKTSVPMAARSPEPAKRCALPQSASAVAAGRWRVRMSSRTSAAAAIRAPGAHGS